MATRRGSARHRRGVSTVVGMALFFILAIVVLSVLYAVCMRTIHTVEQLLSIAKTKIVENELAQQISGWWLLQNGTLAINMTNLSPETVEITAIAIVLSNGSYIALYRNHTLGATCRIALPTGAEISGALSMPLYLGSGYSIEIRIAGVNATPVTISAALSASPGVAMIALRNAMYLHPTIIIRQYKILKPEITNLETLAKRYTTVWGGYAALFMPRWREEIPTLVYVNGSQWQGTASDIAKLDGKTLNVSSSRAQPVLTVVFKPTIYFFTNFSRDPFATGEMIKHGGVWGWSKTAGYEDGGIYQNSTSDTLTDSGELIALINKNPLTDFYIEYYVYIGHASSEGWYDAIVYRSDGSFYELGLYVRLINSSFARASFDAWYWTGTGWDWLMEGVTRPSVTIRINQWYIYVLHFDASTRHLHYMLFDTHGKLLMSFEFTIPSNYPMSSIYRIGIGTYTEAARWDNLALSKYDVVHIKVLNVPSGYTVEILGPSGEVISRNVSVNNVAQLCVAGHPVIRNATVLVVSPSGVVIASKRFDELVGGEILRLSNAYRSIAIDVRVSYNASLVYKYVIELSTKFSTPVNVSLIIASQGEVLFVKTFANTTEVVKNITWIPPSHSLTTIDLVLKAVSPNPFNASIDVLNAPAIVLVKSYDNVLIVGAGGSSSIQVYGVEERSSGIELSYLYSIESSRLGGLTYIVYAPHLEKLVLVNSSGVYEKIISPIGKWVLVSSVCRITVPGAQAQVVDYGSSDMLMLVNGSRLCILNLSSGKLVYSGELSGLSTYSFSCSASNGTAAFFVLNSSRGPVLAVIRAAEGAIEVRSLSLPFTQCVGAAWSSSLRELLLLGDGGPLYLYSSGKNFSVVSWVEPPYSPHEGDRLAAFGGYVVWIRDDYTSEVWVWPLSSG